MLHKHCTLQSISTLASDGRPLVVFTVSQSASLYVSSAGPQKCRSGSTPPGYQSRRCRVGASSRATVASRTVAGGSRDGRHVPYTELTRWNKNNRQAISGHISLAGDLLSARNERARFDDVYGIAMLLIIKNRIGIRRTWGILRLVEFLLHEIFYQDDKISLTDETNFA